MRIPGEASADVWYICLLERNAGRILVQGTSRNKLAEPIASSWGIQMTWPYRTVLLLGKRDHSPSTELLWSLVCYLKIDLACTQLSI